MDKILGEVFDDYVDKQIKVRQRSLGKSQKSADDLVVFNSSTPWIRLSSSVEVEKDKAKTLATNLGISQSKIVGNSLAKNLVLFAGTSDGANLSKRKGGVGYGLESSYGFLSDKEQGYKPMPGITGITANYKNNGTLKQAQVNLTCFTRKQFEAVEAIYLRLGYTMLLEWGHSIYFDNKGKKQSMSSLKVPNILFNKSSSDSNAIALAAVEEALKINPNLTNNQKDAIYFEEEQNARNYPTRLRKVLQDNKQGTGGNYDAMMAKVSNFSWTLNSDLSYSITLDLVSVGDIIDSLKMNFGGTELTRTDTSQLVLDTGIQNLAAIELNSGASAFNSFLNEITQLLQSKDALQETNKTTQKQVELKDEAKKILKELVPKIEETYPPIIDALTKKYVTSYEDIQNFLLKSKIQSYDPRYGRVYDTPENAEFIKDLQNLLKEKGFEELVKLRSYYGEFFIDKFNNEFFKKFDVKLVPTLDDKELPTAKATFAKGNTITELPLGVKELKENLTKIKAQVNKVILTAKEGETGESNLALFRYLGENITTAKKVILNGLVDGFYDGKDKKLESNIQLEKKILSTNLMRKWVISNRTN